MDFYLKRSYAEGTFESCKNVYVPLLNQLALDLMCGRPVSECNPDIWFKYITDPVLSPFLINYKLTNEEVDGFKPLNIETRGCAEKPTVLKQSFNLFI